WEPLAGVRPQGVRGGETFPVRDEGQEAGLGVVGAGVRRGAGNAGERNGGAEGPPRRTDGSGLRITEGHPWDRLVMRLPRSAEDVRRHNAPLVLARMSEQPQ